MSNIDQKLIDHIINWLDSSIDEYDKKKDYDEALEQYIQTIGFLNPGYVI